ncbi:hypothetical protein [Shewanella aestuarii]|uniref:Uncharacterized protein n=1 Tax=Shewanella aestuarii TaxID=1028752 RepID=A0A6G9QM12_9GAMM|nr:hypothetical protein [Shewanella aestuarii]QIR15586.1 hypothetical protein HBH39_14740 [Shewanella aestuarii]
MNAASLPSQQNTIIEEIKNRVLEIDALRNGTKHPQEIDLPLDYVSALDEITQIDREEIEDIARDVIAKHKNITRYVPQKRQKTKERDLNHWLINISLLLIGVVVVQVVFLDDGSPKDPHEKTFATKVATTDFSAFGDDISDTFASVIQAAQAVIPTRDSLADLPFSYNDVEQAAAETYSAIVTSTQDLFVEESPSQLLPEQTESSQQASADIKLANTVTESLTPDVSENQTVEEIAAIEFAMTQANLPAKNINVVATEQISQDADVNQITEHNDAQTLQDQRLSKAALIDDAVVEVIDVADVTEVTEVPATVDVADVSEVTEVPATVEVADVSEVTEVPATVEVADVSEVTEVPATVEVADVSEVTEEPATVEVADVSEVTEVPATVEVADVSEVTEVPAKVEVADVSKVPTTVKIADVSAAKEVPATVEVADASEVTEVPATVEVADVSAATEVPVTVEVAEVVKDVNLAHVTDAQVTSTDVASTTITTTASHPLDKSSLEETKQAEKTAAILAQQDQSQSLQAIDSQSKAEAGLFDTVRNKFNAFVASIMSSEVETHVASQSTNAQKAQTVSKTAINELETTVAAPIKTVETTAIEVASSPLPAEAASSIGELESELVTQTVETSEILESDISNEDAILQVETSAGLIEPHIVTHDEGLTVGNSAPISTAPESTPQAEELVKIVEPQDNTIESIATEADAEIAITEKVTPEEAILTVGLAQPISTEPEPQALTTKTPSPTDEPVTVATEIITDKSTTQVTRITLDSDDAIDEVTEKIIAAQQAPIQQPVIQQPAVQPVGFNGLNLKLQLNSIVDLSQLAKMSVNQFYGFEARLPKPADNIPLPVNDLKAHPLIKDIYLSEQSNVIVKLASSFGEDSELTFIPSVTTNGGFINWKCNTNIDPSLLTGPGESPCDLTKSAAVNP